MSKKASLQDIEILFECFMFGDQVYCYDQRSEQLPNLELKYKENEWDNQENLKYPLPFLRSSFKTKIHITENIYAVN